MSSDLPHNGIESFFDVLPCFGTRLQIAQPELVLDLVNHFVRHLCVWVVGDLTHTITKKMIPIEVQLNVRLVGVASPTCFQQVSWETRRRLWYARFVYADDRSQPLYYHINKNIVCEPSGDDTETREARIRETLTSPYQWAKRPARNLDHNACIDLSRERDAHTKMLLYTSTSNKERKWDESTSHGTEFVLACSVDNLNKNKIVDNSNNIIIQL